MKKFAQISTKTIILANFILAALVVLTTYSLFKHDVARNIESKPPFDAQQIQNSAKTIYDVCKNEAVETCYKKHFDQLVRSTSLAYGQKTLYALQNYDDQLRHCHVLSHAVGSSALRKAPKDWKKLLAEADTETCGGGFFHGIIEGHVADDQNFKIDKNSIYDICHDPANGFREMTCNHIMGHLTLFGKSGDIQQALPTCSSISDAINSRECYTGVFMEDSFKTILADHGLATLPVRDKVRMEKQTERCTKFNGIPGQACWIDLAELFQEYYNNDAKMVYQSCNMAPEEPSKYQCYLKSVVLMAVAPNFDSKEKLISECIPYEQNKDLYKTCTNFIISSLMHYSSKFTDRGVTLCSNISGEFIDYCFKELGQQLKVTEPSLIQREALCTSTPKEYLNLCAQS